jgi:predicted enzyme related to lactoylglutathione lyase
VKVNEISEQKEFFMNQGMKTIIYPVTDINRAKQLFSALLGAEPYVASDFYVGFRVGDQQIGLDPHGHKEGMTGYFHVSDIHKSLQALVDAGAHILQEIKDVGGGGLIASVKDVDGNIIGLLQGTDSSDH